MRSQGEADRQKSSDFIKPREAKTALFGISSPYCGDCRTGLAIALRRATFYT